MPKINTNKTNIITPAMTTEPESPPTEGTSELPSTLVDYDPPGSGSSGGTGGSPP